MTVKIHPHYGVVALKEGWVPSPRYVLRRARILEHLHRWSKRGRVLEVGCGAGALLYELSQLGFDCTGVESSQSAASLASEINEGSATIYTDAADWDATFDYLLALEVLEHIEDDNAALTQWKQWLRPGGRMILSVPAHAERWNASDEWVGHVRRYDREHLREALELAGFEVETLECYGFPLGNLLDRLLAAQCARQLRKGARGNQDRAARTATSGIDRATHTRLFPLYAGPVGSGLIRLFCATQKLFLQTDLGMGLLAVARRR